MWGLFSHRKGLKFVRVDIQTEGMEEGLKNRLWSALYTGYFREVIQYGTHDENWPSLLWQWYFKYPIDRLPSGGHTFVEEALRRYFFTCKWNEVLDLIEAILRVSSDTKKNSAFAKSCNVILETEVYGYRLVNERFVQISSEGEIVEIEDAISSAPDQVSAHLTRSLELFSDRNQPDYRNSIKESISAIEALCRQITNEPKLTLGKALSKIEHSEKVDFHPAFREACGKLYGWTSDAEGIRHSLMDKSNLSQEDARFMLVACSSFANYLIVKADKAGIDLHK